MGKNRRQSEGIRGAFGGIRDQVRAFWVFQYCTELGSSEAKTGGSIFFIILKLERRSYWQSVGRKITGVVLLEFYWRLPEVGVVRLEFYWRACEPAGSVPRSLWVRFGRFGGRQEREIEFKEETLTCL